MTIPTITGNAPLVSINATNGTLAFPAANYDVGKIYLLTLSNARLSGNQFDPTGASGTNISFTIPSGGKVTEGSSDYVAMLAKPSASSTANVVTITGTGTADGVIARMYELNDTPTGGNGVDAIAGLVSSQAASSNIRGVTLGAAGNADDRPFMLAGFRVNETPASTDGTYTTLFANTNVSPNNSGIDIFKGSAQDTTPEASVTTNNGCAAIGFWIVGFQASTDYDAQYGAGYY